jgi:D-alanyl-D-alanine carboxypeptidase/D-alanyl-D-alanine-endopeptidase (penicillin-binding protein 4)
MSLPPVRNVVIDDSIFEETTLHPRWPVDQVQKRYMAEVAGMNLNANCLDVFVRTTSPGDIVSYILNPDTHYVNFQNTCVTGNENAVWLSRVAETNNVIMRGQAAVSTNVPVSVTIHDPAMFAATVLAENLTNAGVEHSGDVHRDRTIRDQIKKAQASGDKSWVVLAVHETPIERVMARANKDSMNLYAECLCKRLGADVSGQSGSWQNGPAAVGEFLKKVGVSDSEFKLDDGCGLSKQNVISASAMVKTLTYDFFSPNSHLFAGTLAVAGVDGTLDDRFRGTDLKARVFGKSGFVNGVSSLSGYLHAKDGQWYAFSILMNGIPAQSNSAIKFLQEKIVRAVDSSTAAVASIDR